MTYLPGPAEGTATSLHPYVSVSRDLMRPLARLIMQRHGQMHPSQSTSRPFLELHIPRSLSSELENCSCRKQIFELSMKSTGTDGRNCPGASSAGQEKLQGMSTLPSLARRWF